MSTPNSDRLERAVEGLDFMLSIDIYVNETTRHADVILPAPSPLEKSQYDLALYQLAARNVANYSPAILESELPAEWRSLARLTGIVSGQGPLYVSARAEFFSLEEPVPARGSELFVQRAIAQEVDVAAGLRLPVPRLAQLLHLCQQLGAGA